MSIYVNGWSFWTPDADNPAASPALDYVPPMLKRRLSQLTRMTIEVVHNVLPIAPDAGIVFVSANGESERQLQIDRMLIEEGSIMPAPFSLSVFNASPAMATIALGIKNGYNAIYPADNIFQEGLIYAASSILSDDVESVILVYADQLLPPEYQSIAGEADNIVPYAAAYVISSKKIQKSVNIDSLIKRLQKEGTGGQA